MPHKYIEKAALDRMRSDISALDGQINSLRKISRKDKEGVDILEDRLKALIESAGKKKNTALDGLMEDGRPRSTPDGNWIPAQLIESRVQERMALIFRGQEQAFEAILEMLNNPDASVAILVEERGQIKKQLQYYEKMEQRESDPDSR